MRLQPSSVLWRRVLTGSGLVLLSYLGVMCVNPISQSMEPKGAVKLDIVSIQAGDEIRFDQTNEDVVAYVTSEKGIGRIDLRRQGAAPRTLTLNLELKGLEELSLTWGDVVVTAHVSSIDGTVRENLTLQGGEATPINDASPYWMPLRIDAAASERIPLESGHFVVNAPKALLDDAPERFSIRWIDFYR